MWPLVWRKKYNLLLLKFFTVKAERDQLAALLVDAQNELNRYKVVMGHASIATKKLKRELGV